MKTKREYLKILALEGSDSADMFLYGFIGAQDWWGDKPEDELTDIAFVKKLNELEAKYTRINIRVNSLGGSMKHGNAIISSIRNSKSEIHTYNDGTAASMAGDIWLAGTHRHMATNSLLMIHAAVNGVWGNAKELRMAADVADKYTETAIAVAAESTGMTEEEVSDLWYNDYEDHWISYKEAKELNLITADDKYTAENVPDGIDKMSFDEILKHFASTEDEEATGLLKQIQNRFNAALKLFKIAKPLTITNDMKVEDLKSSLLNGELSVEDVQKAINEHQPTPPSVETPPAKTGDTPPEATGVDIEKIVADAIAKATDPLKLEIENQKEVIKDLGGKPGATVTKPPVSDGDDYSDGEEESAFKELDAFDEMTKKAAKDRTTMTFK
ncbi:MAG TPA: Clp protease ClpP [Saprospiraceae bacterium]|nr:Clp protease ClpP [Saprospiraceae bacterium]